ncbi:MAG: hypothetical protein COA42_14295 [Alteromonadaceae bacterium]|nr:MAG: hypothetical protein COA42_14295 [Alteromonadaceae bacterium]
MSRVTRIKAFLDYMFPLSLYVPGGVATFFAGYLATYAIAGVENIQITLAAGIGAVSTVLFMLLMRLYDELKDVETDLRLGKAGDPRFKDRPIVTGAVLKEDIVFLRWLVTGILVFINLFLINTIAIYPFVVMFVVGWLSFKWFFIPAISKNLLLALITHNPIAILQIAYVIGIFASIEGVNNLVMDHLYLVVALWLHVAAWETSRKIRLPADETDYQTYSSMLGWRLATLMPLIFSVLSSVCLGVLTIKGLFPIWFLMVLIVVTSVVVLKCLLLLFLPTTKRTLLKPVIEGYLLVVNFGLIVASLLA